MRAYVVGDAGDRAHLRDELGRGCEVVRELVDRRFAACRQRRRNGRVAPRSFGLGECPVRDLANELGLEMELVVLDMEEIALDESIEHGPGIGTHRERQHRRHWSAVADDGTILEE